MSLPLAAQAEDFLSALFGAFGARSPAPAPHSASPFGTEEAPRLEVPRARVASSGGQAWCVRTCDGRYFPVSGSGHKSRAELCNGFCPASRTTLVYGSTIDNAMTDSGKPYSELPNAFRYRNEIVAGCTCNGKDQVGLASIRVEDDPTLRKGDIVAGRGGLVVADRAAGQYGPPNFSPAPRSVRVHFGRVPVVAAE